MIALHRGGGEGSPETICVSQNMPSYVGSQITCLPYTRHAHQLQYSKTPPYVFRTAMLDSKVLFMFTVTVIL